MPHTNTCRCEPYLAPFPDRIGHVQSTVASEASCGMAIYASQHAGARDKMNFDGKLICLGKWRYKGFQDCNQLRNSLYNNNPHPFLLNFTIFMGQYISLPNNATLRDVGMCRSKFFRNMSGRFPDNFNGTLNRKLQLAILFILMVFDTRCKTPHCSGGIHYVP